VQSLYMEWTVHGILTCCLSRTLGCTHIMWTFCSTYKINVSIQQQYPLSTSDRILLLHIWQKYNIIVKRKSSYESPLSAQYLCSNSFHYAKLHPKHD